MDCKAFLARRMEDLVYLAECIINRGGKQNTTEIGKRLVLVDIGSRGSTCWIEACLLRQVLRKTC